MKTRLPSEDPTDVGWPEGWLDDDDPLPDTVREVPAWVSEASSDAPETAAPPPKA